MTKCLRTPTNSICGKCLIDWSSRISQAIKSTVASVVKIDVQAVPSLTRIC